MNARAQADLVAKQYTAWCYPQPVPDVAAYVREGAYDTVNPSLIRRRLWPRRTEPADLDILVAGCGTNQAPLFAFTNPHCRVTGIDVSETSLQHGQYLKERHGLENLNLFRMDLLDVESTGETFDYVVSTGVLHHLADPEAGLRALRAVLRPNGVMSLMLYGRYNRAGVYALKEAFRLVGVEEDARGLDTIKATLAALPPWHHARSYLAAAQDLGYDSGLVDTFLHPVDRPYGVPEVLALVKRAGLAFQGWLDPGFYALKQAFPETHPLRACAGGLPREEQWAVAELVSQRISCHSFFACHPARPASDYRPDFTSQAALAYQPSLSHRTEIDARHVVQGAFHRAQLTATEASWLRRADGARTIREIGAVSNPGTGSALRFFAEMWDAGYVVVELP